VGKAFGIRGELKFHPSDDFWESVFRSQNLCLKMVSNGETHTRPVVVRKARQHGGSYVITIEGIEDRNEAESLVGGEIVIAEDRIDVGRADRLLPYQLLGMTAKTVDGELLGTVSAVLHSPAHEIYEITDGSGVSHLVPAVPEFIMSTDEPSRTIIVRHVTGLIED
jgi:16S rRNA processing protein RimM